MEDQEEEWITAATQAIARAAKELRVPAAHLAHSLAEGGIADLVEELRIARNFGYAADRERVAELLRRVMGR